MSISQHSARKIWEFSNAEYDVQEPVGEQEAEDARNEETARPRCLERNILKVGRSQVDPHLVSMVAPDSPEVEKFRTLRYHVEKLDTRGGGRVVGITSPIAGDGKSMTAINLAATLAQNTAYSVLLLDLDLHQPGNGMKDYLGLGKLKGGVVDLVGNRELTVEQVTYYLPEFNLHVMPSGAPAKRPYDLINSPRLGKLIEATRKAFDFVIVDTAPAGLVSESRLLSRWVDGFFMVVSADITPREMLAEALNTMEPDKVTGLVFNRYSSPRDRYYGYY